MNQNNFCTKGAVRKLHVLVEEISQRDMTPHMMAAKLCVGKQAIYAYVYYLEKLGMIEKSYRVVKSWYYRGTGAGAIPQATHGNKGRMAALKLAQKVAEKEAVRAAASAPRQRVYRDWLQIAFFGHGPAPSLCFRAARITIDRQAMEYEEFMHGLLHDVSVIAE